MKRLSSKKSGLAKRTMAFLLCASLFTSMQGGIAKVHASEFEGVAETTEVASGNAGSSDSSGIDMGNAEVNGKLGKNTDVGIEVTKSITGEPGKKTKISFKLKSLDKKNVKLKSVYPIIDSSFPFETSGDAYKVVKAGKKEDKQAELSASYTMTARSDISEGYQSVKFIGEYNKTEDDGTQGAYYIIKTINIYFEDEKTKDDDDDDDRSSSSGSSYSSKQDDDDDNEPTAPKLILTGMETDPERIMAGDTFKLKIHVQNTSKTTPVCNGKFLIGNEAGNFLPTSGSSAVYVEKIPAGESGDLEIELKTAADLPQKNYILMVKGDFDDGKGNSFTSSDNLSISVYQEVKMGVTDVSMSPSALGIGKAGSLMFTINNQGSAGVYNVKVSVDDKAVTADESYVGNIAASSSAYATLNLVGAKDNSETGTVKVVISYEDSEGNAGKLEQNITCRVGEGFEDDEYDEYDEFDEYEDEYEDEDEYDWWVYLIIAVVAVALIVLIVILVVKHKKKRAAELLADEEDLLDEDGEDDLENEDI